MTGKRLETGVFLLIVMIYMAVAFFAVKRIGSFLARVFHPGEDMLITILLLMAAYAVVIVHQSGQLTSIVSDANDAHDAAVAAAAILRYGEALRREPEAPAERTPMVEDTLVLRPREPR